MMFYIDPNDNIQSFIAPHDEIACIGPHDIMLFSVDPYNIIQYFIAPHDETSVVIV